MLYRADSKIDEVEILLMKGDHFVIDCYYDATVTKPEGYITDCPIITKAMKFITGQKIEYGDARLTDYTFVHKLLLDTIQDKASLTLRGYEKQITIKYIFPYIYIYIIIEHYYVVNIELLNILNIARMRMSKSFCSPILIDFGLLEISSYKIFISLELIKIS